MDEKKEVLKVDMGCSGTKSINIDLPSNSHKNREERDDTRRVEKVTKGRVIKKKKSLGKRFLETFIGDDINSVSNYLIHDVLIPAAKDTISNMVQGGIEMLLFGEKRDNRSRRDSGRASYTSYNSYSSSNNRRDDRRDISYRSRASHNFDEIILDSRQEAERVLNHLVDLTIDYGEATVADLYDLVGISEDHTDRKYGWTNLRSASISRVREGYLLNLPKPIPLN